MVIIMKIDDVALHELRKKIFLTGYSASNAHFPSAFSILEILYTLYCKKVLEYDCDNPDRIDRDRLVLSKGHGSLALYAILNLTGFITDEMLFTFAKPNSFLGGEPTIEIPGVEVSTGSLGHGLSLGVGMALSLKSDNSTSKVFVILGDGECQEGSVWEAVMSASRFELDNLTVILDCNRFQKMGTIKDIIGFDVYNWIKCFESFNWDVIAVDGHSVNELLSAFSHSKLTKKPQLIIAKTIKGKGVSIMENAPNWHWKLPNKKELKIIMNELDITDEEVAECKKLI